MNNPSAFPMGDPNDGFAQYFVGQSYLAPVLDAPEIAIHNVTFEPGCRNHWHIHHGGAQVLIAVGGRGYYQIDGQEPKGLKAGQAVCIPADTKHWHGAAPGEAFSHLAFMVPAGDPSASTDRLAACSTVIPDIVEAVREGMFRTRRNHPERSPRIWRRIVFGVSQDGY